MKRRDDEKAGYFHMSIRDNEVSDQDVVTASAECVRPVVGDLQTRRFEFRPPGQLRWHTYFSQQVRLLTVLPIYLMLTHVCLCGLKSGDETQTGLSKIYQMLGSLLFCSCTSNIVLHKSKCLDYGFVVNAAGVWGALAEPAQLPSGSQRPWEVLCLVFWLLCREELQRSAAQDQAPTEAAPQMVRYLPPAAF